MLTRFSYRDTSAIHNRVVVKSNVSTVNPLSSQRLERRFQLFELFCLPGVLAQTTKARTGRRFDHERNNRRRRSGRSGDRRPRCCV